MQVYWNTCKTVNVFACILYVNKTDDAEENLEIKIYICFLEVRRI